jgi:hypothetical protein
VGDGSDHGTVTMRSCIAYSNAGHGFSLRSQGLRVSHCHGEGNFGAGVAIVGAVGDATPCDHLVDHPWLEANALAGIWLSRSARNRIVRGSGMQAAAWDPSVSSSLCAEMEIVTANGGETHRSPCTGVEVTYANSPAAGQRITAKALSGAKLPVSMFAVIRDKTSIVWNSAHPSYASGVLTLDVAATTHHKITLQADLPTLAIPPGVAGQDLYIEIVQPGGSVTRSVGTWSGAIRWWGGSQPTQTAGPTRRNQIALHWDGAWIEVARGPSTG